MSILNDQLRIDPNLVERVASVPGIEHATSVSVMVGQGGDRHGAAITIWAATTSKAAGIGSIRVGCGSQRAGSSVRNISLTLPVTCERCLISNWYWARVESLPTDVLTTDPRTGTIQPV